MKIKIPIEQLEVGMFLEGVDRPWFDTPFLTHRFRIKNQKQIDKIIDAGIDFVYIQAEGEDQPDTFQEIELETLIKNEVAETHDTDIDDDFMLKPEGPMSNDELKVYAQKKESLLYIDKRTLLPGSFVDFSIYTKCGTLIKPLAEYSGSDILIRPELISIDCDLLIDKTDITKYRDFLKNIATLSSKTEYAKLKNTIIMENTKIVVKELLDDPRSGEKIKHCKTAVEDIISAVHGSKGLVSNLLALNKFDYYTYAHSVNVCVLSVGIAMSTGESKDRSLYSIGIGSLLHDIGKSELPAYLINKNIPLNDEEFNVVKEHVIKGYNILSTHDNIPDNAYNSVLEHHERISGGGYPNGLSGCDMHKEGMITAIADTYDALTTDRTYQKSRSPFDALMIIKKSHDKYDMDIFREFVKMLGKNIESQP